MKIKQSQQIEGLLLKIQFIVMLRLLRTPQSQMVDLQSKISMEE